MKKFTVICLLVVALFAVSCSSDDKKSSTSTTSSTTQSTMAPSAKEPAECNKPDLDPSKTYTVTFTTTQGDFVVTLDVANAPKSSAHLASLVSSGFYDGLIFHRIISGFMVQGGDPNGNGSGSSQCTAVSEPPPHLYKEGDFAWARTGTAPSGSAGSQFFIVTGATGSPNLGGINTSSNPSELTYGYAGTVTSGLNVVKKIEGVTTGPNDLPVEQVIITKATLNS